jgi:uncharacterized small protein (DUF1192 family)
MAQRIALLEEEITTLKKIGGRKEGDEGARQ